MNRMINVAFGSKWTAVVFVRESGPSVLKMPHLLFFFLQLVLVTFVSVQMDLAGQYRVQVVGNIPSGSVQLRQCPLLPC